MDPNAVPGLNRKWHQAGWFWTVCCSLSGWFTVCLEPESETKSMNPSYLMSTLLPVLVVISTAVRTELLPGFTAKNAFCPISCKAWPPNIFCCHQVEQKRLSQRVRGTFEDLNTLRGLATTFNSKGSFSLNKLNPHRGKYLSGFCVHS